MNQLDQTLSQTDVSEFKYHLINTVTRMMETNPALLNENRQKFTGYLEQIYQELNPEFSDSITIFEDVKKK